jgi:hypothetical protein
MIKSRLEWVFRNFQANVAYYFRGWDVKVGARFKKIEYEMGGSSLV